jgi:hypothetical protein
MPPATRHPVASRDLGVFVDQTAEPVPSRDPDIDAQGRRMLASGGRALEERPVRAMDVLVIDVLAQDQLQVPLAGDQHPVQALAPGAGDPPLRDRVSPGAQPGLFDAPRRPALARRGLLRLGPPSGGHRVGKRRPRVGAVVH